MDLPGLAHQVFSKVGLFGLGLIWTLKVAASWTVYRWWKLKRAAAAVMKD